MSDFDLRPVTAINGRIIGIIIRIVAFGIVAGVIGLVAFFYDLYKAEVDNRHRSKVVRLAFDELAQSTARNGEQPESCMRRVRFDEVEICNSVSHLEDRTTGVSCVPTVVFSYIDTWSNSVSSDRLVLFTTFGEGTVRSVFSEFEAGSSSIGSGRVFGQASDLIGTFRDVTHFSCEGYSAITLDAAS